MTLAEHFTTHSKDATQAHTSHFSLFLPLHNGEEKLLSLSLSPLQDKVDSFTRRILSWCDINALLDNFIKGYKALKTGNEMRGELRCHSLSTLGMLFYILP